jgi:hypothetical protein
MQSASPTRGKIDEFSDIFASKEMRRGIYQEALEEALEALARTYGELLANHVQNVEQYGLGNQIESKPAIEAEVVESDVRETQEST